MSDTRDGLRKGCEPYEIEVIGAFISYLMLEKAINGKIGETAIGLYQQCPLDSSHGDLVVGSDDRFFAFEFKRERTSRALKDEKEKWSRGATAWLNVGNNKSLSSSCHFMIYGRDSRSKNEWTFSPFFDEIFRPASLLPENSIYHGIPILVRAIVRTEEGYGLGYSEFREYMRGMLSQRAHGRLSSLMMSASSDIEKKTGRFFHELSQAFIDSGYSEYAEKVSKAALSLQKVGRADFDFLREWRASECDTQFLALKMDENGHMKVFSKSGLIALMLRPVKARPAPEVVPEVVPGPVQETPGHDSNGRPRRRGTAP